MQRLQRLQINVDGRADEDAAEAVTAPPPPPRPRTGSRIASSEARDGAAGGGYATPRRASRSAILRAGGDDRRVSRECGYAVPAVSTGGSVAVWDGNEATFIVERPPSRASQQRPRRKSRSRSERGFLILDARARWSGLRAVTCCSRSMARRS
jgi:hypothetical protein